MTKNQWLTRAVARVIAANDALDRAAIALGQVGTPPYVGAETDAALAAVRALREKLDRYIVSTGAL